MDCIWSGSRYDSSFHMAIIQTADSSLERLPDELMYVHGT
jgi:hypothetical protein